MRPDLSGAPQALPRSFRRRRPERLAAEQRIDDLVFGVVSESGHALASFGSGLTPGIQLKTGRDEAGINVLQSCRKQRDAAFILQDQHLVFRGYITMDSVPLLSMSGAVALAAARAGPTVIQAPKVAATGPRTQAKRIDRCVGRPDEIGILTEHKRVAWAARHQPR